MDIIHLFDHGASLKPDHACFIADGVEHSYRNIQTLTYRIANRLRENGIGADKQVGILSINDPIAFSCVLGALRAGGVWVPLNPRSTPYEHTHLINTFDVEVLFFHSMLKPVVDAMRAQLTTVRLFICIDQSTDNAPALEDWLNNVSDAPTERQIDSGRRAVIAGTGGTTGLPKGVMLSHRNVEVFTSTLMSCAPSDEAPVHLVAVPMTHAAGILCFPTFARGGTNVMLSKPDPQGIMEAIQKYRVTDMFLPPTVIYMLLAQPNITEFDFSSLRYFLYGAAPMSTEKLRQAIRVFGPVMTQAFGQTEAPMICCFMGPKEHFINGDIAPESRLKSCGRPTPFVEVAMMDESGRLLPDGESGEIVVRGDLVMLGYYKNQTATDEVSKFGWHHTGDIGVRDANGYMHIVDRKKDMIISGGYNIYSSEVENAVLHHPAVQDCAVIGVPDDKWGEAVKAVVQLKAGFSVSEEELIEYCKEKVGSVKAPKTIEIWTDLPRSTVGKVLKKDIRKTYWEGRERAV